MRIQPTSQLLNLLLMILLNKNNFTSQFLPFLLSFHQIILQLRTLFLDPVRQLSNLHLSTVQYFFQLANLLLIDVHWVAVLAFEVLELDLALGTDLVDLQVFDVLELG